MKKRVFLFPTAVFLGTACLLSGCGKKSATGNAGEVYVYNWGTVGILYNTSMVAPEDVPTKWADLWDEKFKGEILMQDSVRDAFMVALISLGYSMNTENESELQEAKNLLI